MEYLETCLRQKSEMVIFEAARAICSLKNVTPKELTPAISGMWAHEVVLLLILILMMMMVNGT